MGIFDKIKKAVFGETEEEKQEELQQEPILEIDEPQESKEDDETNEEVVEEAQPNSEEEKPAPILEETVSEEPVLEKIQSTESEADTEPTVEEPVSTSELVETEEVADVPEQEEKPELSEETATEEIQEEVQEVAQVAEAATESKSTTEKYDKGLEKSRRTFGQFMNELFSNFRVVDDEFFEELEEALISSDVGFDMAMTISDELQEEVKLRNVKKPKDVERTIVEKLVEIYDSEGENENNEINFQESGPTIILFVGVNGVGKTTSIGKMANRYRKEGKKVLLAAADTFRAGAIDQLVVWGERAGVEVVRHKPGSDPAAVVFDAVDRTKKEGYDVLLVDTAGRLQNKVNLMKELEKMKRVIEREYPSAPHEVLLVVDATTGQNALIQAKQFKETTDVTGLVLSKLDGTAKGGIVLAIRHELKLPVKLVGLGEGIDDLHDFNPDQFVYGLFKDVIENYE